MIRSLQNLIFHKDLWFHCYIHLIIKVVHITSSRPHFFPFTLSSFPSSFYLSIHLSILPSLLPSFHSLPPSINPTLLPTLPSSLYLSIQPPSFHHSLPPILLLSLLPFSPSSPLPSLPSSSPSLPFLPPPLSPSFSPSSPLPPLPPSSLLHHPSLILPPSTFPLPLSPPLPSLLIHVLHISGRITGSYTSTPSSKIWDNIIFTVPNAATNVVITNKDYNAVSISKLKSFIFFISLKLLARVTRYNITDILLASLSRFVHTFDFCCNE